MKNGIVVLVVSIFVEMQLDDILELQWLARDRMLPELLYIGYNVCDIVYGAV